MRLNIVAMHISTKLCNGKGTNSRKNSCKFDKGFATSTQIISEWKQQQWKNIQQRTAATFVLIVMQSNMNRAKHKNLITSSLR